MLSYFFYCPTHPQILTVRQIFSFITPLPPSLVHLVDAAVASLVHLVDAAVAKSCDLPKTDLQKVWRLVL